MNHKRKSKWRRKLRMFHTFNKSYLFLIIRLLFCRVSHSTRVSFLPCYYGCTNSYEGSCCRRKLKLTLVRTGSFFFSSTRFLCPRLSSSCYVRQKYLWSVLFGEISHVRESFLCLLTEVTTKRNGNDRKKQDSFVRVLFEVPATTILSRQ